MRNAEAGAAALMGELIENYMKPLKVSLDPAALVFADRLTYAASVAEVTLGDAARHCSAYKVSGAQLTAIIGKRLKLIGRRSESSSTLTTSSSRRRRQSPRT